MEEQIFKGNHIYNCDCMEMLNNLPSESVDMIVTDPPYKTTPKGNTGTTGGMFLKSINKAGKVFEYNDIDCTRYAPELYRVLKEGGHCYVMTNHINLIHMLNVFYSWGFHFVKSLIWNKGNKIVCSYYMSQFEYILFFRKGRGKKINNCGTSDILNVPQKKTKGVDGKNLHDTEKPVELMQILIENSSNKGELVLDPFMGIGATAIACIRTGRSFLGAEIDENYYKIATERIKESERIKTQTLPEVW